MPYLQFKVLKMHTLQQCTCEVWEILFPTYVGVMYPTLVEVHYANLQFEVLKMHTLQQS